MARKTRAKVKVDIEPAVMEAYEEWKAVTEMRHELAKEAYDFQDEETQHVLDRIRDRLRLGANGYVTIQVNHPHGAQVPVKVEQEYLDYNIMYVAVEILKDLALFDIRVGSFQFPPSQCVTCGAEIIKEQPKPKKKGRR